MPYESEKLLARFENTTVEKLHDIPEAELPKGEMRERMIKVRVNQHIFRRSVLAAYNNTCCITGLQQPELLIAGHIRPWGIDEANRMKPTNGLAMNALHDKAFENGLITIITPDYKVLVSSVLKKQKIPSVDSYFLKFENQPIILPTRALPDVEFLKYHNDERFKP